MEGGGRAMNELNEKNGGPSKRPAAEENGLEFHANGTHELWWRAGIGAGPHKELVRKIAHGDAEDRGTIKQLGAITGGDGDLRVTSLNHEADTAGAE